jgi:hypothetical protein
MICIVCYVIFWGKFTHMDNALEYLDGLTEKDLEGVHLGGDYEPG